MSYSSRELKTINEELDDINAIVAQGDLDDAERQRQVRVAVAALKNTLGFAPDTTKASA